MDPSSALLSIAAAAALQQQHPHIAHPSRDGVSSASASSDSDPTATDAFPTAATASLNTSTQPRSAIPAVSQSPSSMSMSSSVAGGASATFPMSGVSSFAVGSTSTRSSDSSPIDLLAGLSHSMISSAGHSAAATTSDGHATSASAPTYVDSAAGASIHGSSGTKSYGAEDKRNGIHFSPGSTAPAMGYSSRSHNHAPKNRDMPVAKVQIRVKLACSNCKASKTKCDDERPCRRCVRTDRAHTCTDSDMRAQVHEDESFTSAAAAALTDVVAQQHAASHEHEGADGHDMNGVMTNGATAVALTTSAAQAMARPAPLSAHATPYLSAPGMPPHYGMPQPHPMANPAYHPYYTTAPPMAGQPHLSHSVSFTHPLMPPPPPPTGSMLKPPPMSTPPSSAPPASPLNGLNSNMFHTKSPLTTLDDRPGKKSKGEDNTIAIATALINESGNHADKTAVTKAAVMSASNSPSSTPAPVVAPMSSVPLQAFCAPSTAAGREWLDTLIITALPHLHTWQIKAKQMHEEVVKLETSTESDQRPSQMALKRADWLQSFFMFMHNGGRAGSNQPLPDLTSTLAVPKHLYSQLELGVLLFPVGTSDFAHSTPPWVNESLTKMLGYPHSYQLAHQFSSMDGIATIYPASNLPDLISRFVACVMKGESNYSCKSKWRHQAGHWVEMLESINLTFDPKDGHIIYIAILMQVVQPNCAPPVPPPSLAMSLSAGFAALSSGNSSSSPSAAAAAAAAAPGGLGAGMIDALSGMLNSLSSGGTSAAASLTNVLSTATDVSAANMLTAANAASSTSTSALPAAPATSPSPLPTLTATAPSAPTNVPQPIAAMPPPQPAAPIAPLTHMAPSHPAAYPQYMPPHMTHTAYSHNFSSYYAPPPPPHHHPQSYHYAPPYNHPSYMPMAPPPVATALPLNAAPAVPRVTMANIV